MFGSPYFGKLPFSRSTGTLRLTTAFHWAEISSCKGPPPNSLLQSPQTCRLQLAFPRSPSILYFSKVEPYIQKKVFCPAILNQSPQHLKPYSTLILTKKAFNAFKGRFCERLHRVILAYETLVELFLAAGSLGVGAFKVLGF